MQVIYCKEKGGFMDYVKKYWYWFLIIGAILLCMFLNGCGKLEREIIEETTETTKEIVKREPYPILRAYEKKEGWIEFTDTTSGIEITTIYYDHSTADSINVRCPVGNNGKTITVQFRGKTYNYSVYDNNSHTFVFYTGVGDDWADGKHLGIAEDVLNIANQYDYIRLFVGNILTEYYYLSDF